MRLTKKIAPAILGIGFGGMIFGIGLGIAVFVRDHGQTQAKFDIMPIMAYIFWLGLVLVTGLVFSHFNLMRTSQLLGRWGIGPGLLLTLLNLEWIQSLHWALLQWPGFLIWFGPLGIACLILGVREMRQTKTETRQHEN